MTPAREPSKSFSCTATSIFSSRSPTRNPIRRRSSCNHSSPNLPFFYFFGLFSREPASARAGFNSKYALKEPTGAAACRPLLRFKPPAFLASERMPDSEPRGTQWENATAGAIAGFATVATLHPLDVVRTRFQVNDGRISHLPTYRNTGHAVFTIARNEGLRGLYAGFFPAVVGSTVSWGLYFFFYNKAKQKYSKGSEKQLSPSLHLLSAAEAGALVCLFTNPIWLVKTRLQLQTPQHQNRPYSGFSDALRTITKEEGLRALYRGVGPSLLLVSHGAIQFTAYEEFRKIFIHFKCNQGRICKDDEDKLLNSVDYALLGASSKIAAILLTYPYQVIRARLQQRPSTDGVPKYVDSWHVVKETVRFEGIRGFYRGITSNLLKNVPAASITFVVYENVLGLLKLRRRNN